MGRGLTVKIWYGSGAYEQVTHHRPEIASRIFDDAAANPRVETAELHEPDGALLDHFRH